MTKIQEQLLIIGNDLVRRSGLHLEAQVKDGQVLSLEGLNKVMEFFIASSHILEGKREYVLVCSDLENHNHTRLEIALYVGLEDSYIEYLNYPPHDSIIKHFDK